MDGRPAASSFALTVATHLAAHYAASFVCNNVGEEAKDCASLLELIHSVGAIVRVAEGAWVQGGQESARLSRQPGTGPVRQPASMRRHLQQEGEARGE